MMTHLFLLCKVNMLRLWCEIPGFHSLIIVELPSHHVILLAEPDFLIYFLLFQAEPTSQKKSWHLLQILPKRGPGAFSCFCAALRETNQQFLSDMLTQCPERDGVERHMKVDGNVNIRCHVTAHRIYTVWPGFVRITVDINGVSRIFIHRNLKYTEFKGL